MMSSLFSRSKKKSDADGLGEQRLERSGSVAIPAEPRPSMVAVGNLVAGNASIQQMQIETRAESRLGERGSVSSTNSSNNPPVNSGSHHRSATHSTAINLGLQAQPNANNSNAAQSAVKDVPSANSSNNSAYYGNASNDRGGEDSLSTLESAMSMPVVPPNSTISASSLSSTGGMGMPSTIITTTVDDELSAQLVNQLGTALPPRGTRHGQLPSLAVPAQQLQHALQLSSSSATGGSSGGMQAPALVTVAADNDSLSDTMERMKLSANGQAGNPGDVPRKTSISASSSSSSTAAQNKKVKSISYAAERVIGNGSFGVVYQASVIETGETVAIKKVLQDKRFKNRELQIMGMLDHPNIVSLKHCFDGQTPLTLTPGMAITIQQLAQAYIEIDKHRSGQPRPISVLSHNGAAGGMAHDSLISAWEQPQRKACVQLTFEDGRQVVCTADHQFLSASGQWIAAKDIPLAHSAVGSLSSSSPSPASSSLCHRIQCTPQSPLFEFGVDDKESSWQLGTFHCRSPAAALRSVAFMRVYGYLCSAMNDAEQCMSFEDAFDAQSFVRDLHMVGSADCAAEPADGRWRVNVPFDILGLIQLVKRTQYVSDNLHELPSVLVRAFLQGVFSRCQVVDMEQIRLNACPASCAATVQQLLALISSQQCFHVGDCTLSFASDFSLHNFLQLIGLPYSAKQWLHASLLSSYNGSKQSCSSTATFEEFVHRIGASSSLLPPSSAACSSSSRKPWSALPTFHLAVLARCDAGMRRVYDASVSGQPSFLANGFTAHNCFYSRGDKNDEIYLNLVMEYIPETIHRTIRNHTKAGKLLPITYVKCYLYQMCRSLVYIHHGAGICHRDIKPQNLLLNTKTHEAKLCDFGSAKILVASEPNVSYICSRYYRAPELVFEATDYSTAIDTWSLGCVFAEMLLGNPLFPGESGVDQLIEIIKILGTPSREEIYAMNPNHTSFKFPQIKPHPWNKVFRGKAPPQAVDLVSKLLVYDPRKRLDSLEALTHPFFDELRDPNAKLPNGKAFPNLFNFTDIELREMQRRGLTKKIVPPDILKKLKLPNVTYDPSPFVPPPWDKLPQRVQTPATATPAGSISQNSQSTSISAAASTVSTSSAAMSTSK